ncbi:MAG: hypothetical protein OEL53_05835 [Rhodospirillales bacterium]|nr:hypothetical protein [Rhodospirillales bacterium]
MPKAKASKEIRVSRKRLHPKPSSGFMSLTQVCEEFGLSSSFLYHLPADRLPRYLIGEKVYYIREEVIDAIKGHKLAFTRRKPRTTGGKSGRPRKPVIPENETAAANPL